MIVIRVVWLMFHERESGVEKLPPLTAMTLFQYNVNSWINDKRFHESVNSILKRAKTIQKFRDVQVIKNTISTLPSPRSIHILPTKILVFHFSNWLSALRMGSLERVRRKVWNRHKITYTINSEGTRERRQTLLLVYSKARLRGLQMQKLPRAESSKR